MLSFFIPDAPLKRLKLFCSGTVVFFCSFREVARMWFISFVKSSIGKKTVMAASGLLLIAFLTVHAFGNAAIYMGGNYFQIYADALHGFPVLVWVFGVGLVLIFAAHIVTASVLYIESLEVRTSRYHVQTRVVENTFASRTMPYTGLVILVFLIVHVFGFVVAPAHDVPISVTVRELLSNVVYGLFYIVSFVCLAIHLSHGFWSMLQTFGVSHPRFDTFLVRSGIAVAVFFLLFFSGIPIYFITGT